MPTTRCFLAAALLAVSAAHAQNWRVQDPVAVQGPGGMPLRSLRVSESGPGTFTVHETSQFAAGTSANTCITRLRSGKLEMAGQRQVLTVAAAVPGCPEIRFLIEPDGSGWEEARSSGQWVPTGARLVGTQQVVSSRPVAAPAEPVANAQVATPAPRPDETRREPPVVAPSANRRALVIGNDSYRHVGRLQNARADAQAIAAALGRDGFRVTLKLDVDERAFKQVLREFRASVQGGDDVVMFYAGHGVQVGGANYLLPVDIHGESEEQVRDDALPLQRILDDVADRRARFTLAVVDACRDNPFRGSGRAIGSRGLAPTTAATGQMVIYSAGSGQQALDKLGPEDRSPNGLFTRVFLREMETPGVPVDRVLRNVRSEVGRLARSVGHTQTPALYDQTEGDFFLKRAQ